MIFIDFAMSSRNDKGELVVHSYKVAPVKNGGEDFDHSMILVSF